jgi:hypothetical protein
MKTLEDKFLEFAQRCGMPPNRVDVATVLTGSHSCFMAGAAAMAELFFAANNQNVDHRCKWTTPTGERCELWKNHGDAHAWQILRL